MMEVYLSEPLAPTLTQKHSRNSGFSENRFLYH
jgi:hypothetical protein